MDGSARTLSKSSARNMAHTEKKWPRQAVEAIPCFVIDLWEKRRGEIDAYATRGGRRHQGGPPHHPRATHGWTWDTIVRLQLRASKSLTTVSPVLEAQRSESVDVSTAFVRRRLTRAVRAGTFSAVIGPPSIDMPLVVAIEPLFVTRGDAARLLSLSTVELDKLRASGRIVARRYGRRVLFPIDELRRFAESLPADELGA